MVVDICTREWSYYGPGIPEGFQVHHMDFDIWHNCSCNLLMIQAELHDGTSACSQPVDPETGRYMSRKVQARALADAPDWVVS
jgi:hypothetical protein